MPIRLAEAADAGAIAAIYAPYVKNTTISFEETPPDAAEIAARIANAAPRFGWLVSTDADRVLGFAPSGSHRSRAAYRWSVEVGIYVDAAAHRRGVGRSLYSALFELLSAQGYAKAFAGITLPNDRSEAFHQAVGFERVGTYRKVGFKHGAWRDTTWYQRALAAPAGTPAEPRPITAPGLPVRWEDTP